MKCLAFLFLSLMCFPTYDFPATKYRKGDCVSMEAMRITDEGGWDSSGWNLASFQIIDIIETDKMNTYMADHLHGKRYYKIQMRELEKYKKNEKLNFVIPMEDLDKFRYSGISWPLDTANDKYKCNRYRED